MRVPPWIVPLLIVLLALLGLGGAKLFAIPSLELDFPAGLKQQPARERTVELLVDGVKCVDTARRAATALEDLPGIHRYVAFASRNRIEVTYDPELLGVEQLRQALEGPIFDEGSGEFLFNAYKVIEIDGRPVSK